MMKYCYECGGILKDQWLENEGMIPYCQQCGVYRFPIFSTAVSMIVLSPQHDRILLIRQYGKPGNILVAGYVNRGESAEEAVCREVREEIGLEVTALHFNKSKFFAPSNTLMLNYACTVSSDSLEGLNTAEVDAANWYSPDEAREEIRPESLAKHFLLYYLEDRANEPELSSNNTNGRILFRKKQKK